MIASLPRRTVQLSLALALLGSSPALAAGAFDGEWQGRFLGAAGCPGPGRSITAVIRNYVFVSPLARGGLPVIGTIRGDNSLNLFWDGDRFLSGTFRDDRFDGEIGFGGSRCKFAMRRVEPPQPGTVGAYDGAWRLVEIGGCLADYRVDFAIYVSGVDVTGIATGWLTEEFTGKMSEDGRFEANATRYRIFGRLPLAGNEVEIKYDKVGGDCAGTAKMTRRKTATPAEE